MIDIITKGLFLGGAGLMAISTVLIIIIVGSKNNDTLEAVKETRLFVGCTAYMVAGIGLKYLFT